MNCVRVLPPQGKRYELLSRTRYLRREQRRGATLTLNLTRSGGC